MEHLTEDEGFLTEDRTAHLEIPLARLEAVKEDIARLRRPPDHVEFVALESGRIEVRLTFYRGTPEDLFKKLVQRLLVIEQRNQ